MISREIVRQVVYSIMPENLVEKIIIFGSIARGDSRDDSDTDICIITREELSEDMLKIYRGRMNYIFAFDYRTATDILIKSGHTYNRYKNVVGAIEYAIAEDGVVL